MYLTDEGKNKVITFLEKKQVNMTCNLCSQRLLVNNEIVGLVQNIEIMGKVDAKYYCQLNCENCGNTFLLPIGKFELKRNSDFN